MRVLIRRPARRCASVLAGIFLAAGTGAPAAAETADALVLEEGKRLTVDLSSADRVRVVIAPGDGTVLVEILERFVELAVKPGTETADAPLRRSVSAESLPILWLHSRDPARPADVALHVTYRTGRNAHAIVTMRTLADDGIAAAAAEAAASALPASASDGEFRAAVPTLLEAASRWRSLDERAAEARATLAAASLSLRLGNKDVAKDLAEAAATIFAELGDALNEAFAHSTLGLVHIRRRDAAAARAAFEQARPVLATLYSGSAVNPADSNLCYLALVTNALETARQCYNERIAETKAFGDTLRQARYETNLAGVYSELGDTVTAAEMLKRLIEDSGDAFSPNLRRRQLNGYAKNLRYLGRPQAAITFYQEALTLARSLGDQSEVDRVLNNLAVVYSDLGAPHQALPILEQLFQRHGGDGDLRALLSINNYGGALIDAGQYGDAASLLDEGITLANRLNNAEQLTTAQRLRAELALREGDPDLGLSLAARAVDAAARAGDGTGFKARALLTLGRAHIDAGAAPPAIEAAEAALELWREAGNPYGEVTALATLGRARYVSGETAAARIVALEAIERIERLRTSVASSDLRASYQSGVAEVYETAILCLVDTGDTDGALELAERFRARTLIDALSTEDGSSTVDAPPELLAERAELISRINRAEDERIRGGPAVSIAGLLSKLDVVDARIAAADPRLARIRDSSTIDVDEMRALHGDGEATIAYFLGRERGLAWIVDRDRVLMVELPDGPATEAAARALHNALSKRGDYRGLARGLGEQLLLPIRDALEDVESLAIVADGGLHYVPFDVLTVGTEREPVLASRSIAYLPSLTTLALSRQLPRPNGNGVTVIADPVFGGDDDRVRDGDGVRGPPGLNRLRLTRLEAEAITAQAKGVDVRIHMGLSAQPAVLRSDDVAGAAIVHIATHGFADDQIPARSGIALSMVDPAGKAATGFVGLRDIYGLELDADLVVLSACETALGQDLAGEGLLGLTRGFMYAGARRVVATLWRVEDRAAAELMTSFYAALFSGAPPAAALAKAKAALRANPRFRHPYYWSGYTLQGDWRSGAVR